MDLRKSRKIVCALLTLIMAIGMLASVGGAVLKYTVCRSTFMEKFLQSGKIIEQCDASYNAMLKSLEEETGIPARIYQAANDKFILTETAVDRMYKNQDASMYNIDKIEVYEKLCKEYLDGSNIKYDSDAVHMAAQRAAEIYSDCYGISNSESLYFFIDDISQKSSGIISLGLLFVIVPIAAIIVIFTKRENLLSQLFASISCCGFSLVLFGIIGIAAGVGKGIMITPQIYADAFVNAIRLDFIFIIMIGAIISALAVYGAVKTNSAVIKKRMMDN